MFCSLHYCDFLFNSILGYICSRPNKIKSFKANFNKKLYGGVGAKKYFFLNLIKTSSQCFTEDASQATALYTARFQIKYFKIALLINFNILPTNFFYNRH